MQIARLNKSVIKVIVLEKDKYGNPAPTVLYKKKRKRKKATAGLRSLEKVARRFARADSTYSDAYLEKHERSNRKRRDGWLKDLAPNMARAERKGIKKLRLIRLLTG